VQDVVAVRPDCSPHPRVALRFPKGDRCPPQEGNVLQLLVVEGKGHHSMSLVTEQRHLGTETRVFTAWLLVVGVKLEDAHGCHILSSAWPPHYETAVRLLEAEQYYLLSWSEEGVECGVNPYTTPKPANHA